jgi:hypothetical protein
MIGNRYERVSRSLRRHILRRVSVAILAAAALTVGLLAASTVPALAEAPPVGCPATYFCFYADPGYSGGMGKVQGDNANFKAFSTSTHNCGNGNWDNCVSSAYNNGTRCTVFLWSDAGYRGKMLTLAKGQGYSNLKSVNFDDTLSSNHWCTQR